MCQTEHHQLYVGELSTNEFDNYKQKSIILNWHQTINYNLNRRSKWIEFNWIIIKVISELFIKFNKFNSSLTSSSSSSTSSNTSKLKMTKFNKINSSFNIYIILILIQLLINTSTIGMYFHILEINRFFLV